MNVKIKKVHPDAKLPVYSTSGSAGFDFFSIEDIEVKKGNPKIIRTGLQAEIPFGYVLLLFSRSGHGFKKDIRLSNCVGIIDSDFRSEIMIKLIQDENELSESFKIISGDRISQGIIIPYPKISFEEVDELSITERMGGFGSTGE